MTDLIACLSSGEKSWAHVSRLIKEQEWKKIFLITNDFGRQNFKTEKNAEFIVVDFQKPVFELIEDIKSGLKGKLTDLEVALNIVSGSGKEHMAILSALLKLGVGVRLMAVTKDG
ncbi:hypothetical protein J4480_02510, partial [Candidatus Woesearchaeota archaeon]|nr:hypothetical protein [Candidatus Woesearchaeota archaeon]